MIKMILGNSREGLSHKSLIIPQSLIDKVENSYIKTHKHKVMVDLK